MRRLLVLACLLLLFGVTVAAQFAPHQWNTEGPKNNPGANTLLCEYVNAETFADTRIVHFVVSSTVTTTATTALFFEQMDAANTTALRSQPISLQANFPPYNFPNTTLTLDVNERVRVRTSGALTGLLQCALFIE